MKKEFLITFLIVSILVIAGCVVQPPVNDQEEIDLVKELQEIERQLEATEEGSDDEKLPHAKVMEDDEVMVEKEDSLDDDEAMEVTEEFDKDDLFVDTSTLQRIEVEETELVDLQISAEDEDEDDLTYLFSPPLDENGMWQTGYTDAGEYIVTVAATDGENTVEQKILLVVNKKNVAPEISGVLADIEVDEGDVVEITPQVDDVNEDSVIVSFSAPLDEEGLWETDHTSAGEYKVSVTATDGEAETVFDVTLVVNDVNVPPEITGVLDEITLSEGETVTIEPVVSDLDGDTVEVSISEPVGDTGVWETTFTDNGEYTVTVAASDGKDTVSKEVKIVVTDVNVPPTIVSISQG